MSYLPGSEAWEEYLTSEFNRLHPGLGELEKAERISRDAIDYNDNQEAPSMAKNKKLEKNKTGEVGFCNNCAELVEVIVDPMDRLDERIFKAVRDRGYLSGWDLMQFITRQVIKAQEELGEMSASVSMPGIGTSLYYAIETAADIAKHEFDHGEFKFSYLSEAQIEELWEELTDLQVVLTCAAKAIQVLTGERRDLMRSALEKAEHDIERGVR